MSEIPRDDQFGKDGPAGLNIIMVVEPDILARMVLADYLRRCGYRVIEGSSAADALTVLGAGNAINIVMAAAQLPGGIDGFSLASRIRETYPGVDVILTTGVAHAADKAGDLCEEGPLDKPYHPQELVRRINVLRERRRTAK